MNEISAYYGKVSRCACTNPEIPEPCNKGCFCRGYVAQCLRCMGTGLFKEPVAGASGEMSVTCGICGGKGKFGVNKPKDWDILNPPPVPVEAAMTPQAADGGDVVGDAIEVHETAATVDPKDPTWQTPHPKPMHMHNTPLGEPVASVR